MYIIILTMQIAFQRYKLKHMLYMFKKKKTNRLRKNGEKLRPKHVGT